MKRCNPPKSAVSLHTLQAKPPHAGIRSRRRRVDNDCGDLKKKSQLELGTVVAAKNRPNDISSLVYSAMEKRTSYMHILPYTIFKFSISIVPSFKFPLHIAALNLHEMDTCGLSASYSFHFSFACRCQWDLDVLLL